MHGAAILDSEVGLGVMSSTFRVRNQSSGGASGEISDWDIRNSDFSAHLNAPYIFSDFPTCCSDLRECSGQLFQSEICLEI